MKKFIDLFKISIFIIGIGLLFSSCVSQKNIRYLQQLAETQEANSFKGSRDINYKIKEGDNLYIKIISDDPRSSTIFNSGSISGTGTITQNDAGIYLNSYTVNEEGFIIFPLIGSFEAKNKKE